MEDYKTSALPIEAGKYLIENTGTPSVDSTFYQKLAGQLLFATNTRFDICFDVVQLSRFMAKPQESHLEVGFQTLQYLKVTLDHSLFFN